MIRISLFGSLKATERHLEKIRALPDCIITGMFADYMDNGNFKFSDHPARVFKRPEELFKVSDAVIFPDNVYQNFENIKIALKKSRHVFLFPDVRLSFHQLEELQKLAEEAGVLLYIRHDFNSIEIKEFYDYYCTEPEYINVYRYQNYQELHAGKSIFETLYQEVLFMLSVNPHGYRKFLATTVPYCSPDPSLVNVRIEFTNGTTANLTVNNYTNKNRRIAELFIKDRLIRIDSFDKELKIIQRNPNHLTIKDFELDLNGYNKPEDEIGHFLKYIHTKSYPASHFESGIAAHKTATEIINHIIPYPVS